MEAKDPRTARIAIVVPGLVHGGGVPIVARFLFSVLTSSETFEPSIISVATSALDANSVRLLSPKSWFRGVTITDLCWGGIPVKHVGAVFPELESQRYRSRKRLTELLQEYDLIQVVAGAPAIALSTSKINKPVCLFVATRVYEDRISRLREKSGLNRMINQTIVRHVSHLEKEALSCVDHVFAESNYTLDLLKELVPEAKLSLGPPGVDIDHFFPSRQYKRDGYLLAVGRLSDPRKNIRLLLEAYALLVKQLPACPKLLMVGLEGPTQSDLLLARELNILDLILVKENVPFDELASLYREASLFVLSSNEEGLGIVILEAMASGIPVISTRCGGPATAVQDGQTGLLVSVGAAEEMAEAMHELLTDPVRREQMGKKARRVAETVFSLEAASQGYLEKYQELLSMHRQA